MMIINKELSCPSEITALTSLSRHQLGSAGFSTSLSQPSSFAAHSSRLCGFQVFHCLDLSSAPTWAKQSAPLEYIRVPYALQSINDFLNAYYAQ
jgi:hypothetical protein